MFARLTSSAPALDALQEVEALVRARYALGEGDLVLVREEVGRVPGQPATLTTVLFWRGGERHRVRLFKPVAEMTEGDLPARWVAGALRDEGEADCC